MEIPDSVCVHVWVLVSISECSSVNYTLLDFTVTPESCSILSPVTGNRLPLLYSVSLFIMRL